MTNINSQTLIIALLALIIGFGGGYVSGGDKPAPGSHTMSGGSYMKDSEMGMNNAMDEMMSGLEGKKGDDFDQAFLAEMILHHEGAVDMAEAALISAKHPEIKDMARAIIMAQTAEIAQMKQWADLWYGAR